MITQRIIDLLPWIVTGITIIVVVVSVIVTIAAHTERKKIACELIVNYLKDKEFTMMSFERIRKNIDQTFSDSFLASLPASFPSTLRHAKLRDENGELSKPGLARITKGDIAPESETETQQVSISVKSLRRLRDMNSFNKIRDELDRIINKATSSLEN